MLCTLQHDALYGVVLKYKNDTGEEKQWIVPKTFEEIKKFQVFVKYIYCKKNATLLEK